ncbi:MAG: rhomboid family intramembrane serine protease [Anaerolineaceae bacterium]
MIPIRDEIKTRHTPVVTYILIAINVIVFIIELNFGSDMDAMMYKYAMIPSEVTTGFDVGDVSNIFTSMFMHAGWTHLIGNMLYLWIFGDNVEDRLGHFRYLAFYLVGGVVAAFAHIAINPSSQIPTVGASGAIAAVLGAYLVLYPRSRVYTFIPLGFFFRLTLLPASLVLIIWFIMQLFNGVLSIGSSDVGGTAFWAHIGGFVFGAFIGLLFRKGSHPATVTQW